MSKLDEIKLLNEKYKEYSNSVLPLCAAENAMSDFSKLPLSSSIQEKYILGGTLSLNKDHNFIEGELLFEYYDFLTQLCQEIFGAKYTDARTLSGMNALTTLLMSTFEIGDKVLVSSIDSGGHDSIYRLCYRLGLEVEILPFDFEQYDFNYEKINQIIENDCIAGIIIAPSDIQYYHHLENLKLNDTILIYDATQILGFIATDKTINPLYIFPEDSNVFLMGATHKTLPGPSCGIIMCRNLSLAKKVDEKINPMFLRNTQMHQILSLIYTLLEFQEFGKKYMHAIHKNVQEMTFLLESSGFELIKKANLTSQTHQIHFYLDKDIRNSFYKKAIEYSVSLNQRDKLVYRGSGIRLGLQEIARYNYSQKDLKIVVDVLRTLRGENQFYNSEGLSEALNILKQKRKIHYTFMDIDQTSFI
ncbi:hydoxy methyltransferase [Lactococcus petauri]|uniref:hydoxy methyltransferase n=1 Tax=Lactococcus petauri TaxID=1940789 RepID=UPI002078C23B|nr:hydoxy methyltransferase [Lactococcus petauri]USI65349.1 hydoxy methyltransferase [Lactococcus petauri]USI67844.1 hydoxy methyltransferase [Lactococcus petauri]WJE12505.1 hydoxy methyltransferase [Lactococcus petauri]